MEVQNGICYQSINGLTKKNSTKMKIALLTIWHEKNYGAELQAYATIKAIKHLGHCPEKDNLFTLVVPKSKKNIFQYSFVISGFRYEVIA